jgi:hypothetical protein
MMDSGINLMNGKIRQFIGDRGYKPLLGDDSESMAIQSVWREWIQNDELKIQVKNLEKRMKEVQLTLNILLLFCGLLCLVNVFGVGR